MEEEEELHLYSWLDPKNEGRVYTEEEAREEIGNIVNADDYIAELKEQGIVRRGYEENNEYFEKKVDSLKEEIELTPYQRYGTPSRLKLSKTQEGLTRDEKLDNYYTEIDDEGYDRRGYSIIQDMMCNLNNITDFLQGDMQQLKGKFAEANKRILEYSLDNLDAVYYYISSSMIPAMEAVKELTRLLNEREEYKRKYNDTHNLLEGERDREPPKQVQMPRTIRQLNYENKLEEVTVYDWVNNVEHWKWQCRCRDLMEKEDGFKEKIEELAKEAEKQLELVEKYENENIKFTSFVDDML